MCDSKRWTSTSTPSVANQWMPPAICEKELVITYIESPCMFWASLVNQVSKQADIDCKLSNLCSSLPKLKTEPVLGKTYACMYSYDKNWYRCKVTLIMNKTHVEVLYVDYGNREVVERTALVELPQVLSDLHILAYPYWLLRLKSIRHEGTIEKGIEFLENLKAHNHFTATLHSKTKDSVIPITVKLNSGQDLAELLVQKKFCTYMTIEELKQKFPSIPKSSVLRQNLERSRSLVAGDASKSVSPHKGSVKLGGVHMDNPSRTQSISNVAKSQLRSKSRSPIRLVKLRSMNGDQGCLEPEKTSTSTLHTDESRMILTTKHLMEKKNMEHGLEQLSLELTETSNEVLSLQLTNNNLKQDLDRHKKSLTETALLLRNREAFFDTKLKNLTNYARSVHGLRLRITRQEELRIDMDRVCDMLLSMQPSNPVLRKISSVQAVFENLQNKIKDKNSIDEELNKLISARDSARKLLHSDLEEFLYNASPFPFEEMFGKIKRLLRGLVREELMEDFERSELMGSQHDAMSSVTELSEERYQAALLNYRNWRSRNLKDHHFYEAKLDEKKKIICNAFNFVVRTLDDDMTQCFDQSCLNNVDRVVKEFEIAANEESSYLLKELGERFEDVKMSNVPLVEDEELKELLVRKSGDWLWSSVQGLLHELSRVERLLKRNKLLVTELAQWLIKVPNVTNLKEVMKVLKVLKSQLRHQLADHADLEEDKATKPELSTEDNVKMRLLEKLNQTRAALQERLELNDDIMLSMMESDLKQFPELTIFHPDIPFNIYMEYSPIVRHGRSLDQYYTRPINSEPNSFQSIYIGKAVVLQEYFLLNKSFKQFENCINVYLSCFNDHSVNRIEFIFQDARKQTGVVQSLYREHNFGKMLGMNSDENMMLYMLYNILVDLQCMHNMGLVHGCLNPSYILYDSANWMAFIRPYNFNLTPVERAKENVWKGVRFTSPEVLLCLPDNQASPPIDMFSFGLLLYQTHRPLEPGRTSRDIIEGLPRENSTSKLEMVKQLLNEDPNTRPSAEELLKTPFWLEVAVDYQKGKAFMMKQVAVATENSEKAVAMLIDNMQTSQVDVTLKKSGSGGSRYKTPSHQSDEVSSIQNDEELVEVRKKEKKRSKVKFELESDESSTVEEYEEGSEAGEESESSKRKDNDDASSGALSDEASENPTGSPLISSNSEKNASNSLEQRMFGVKRFPKSHNKGRKPRDSEDEYDMEDDEDDDYDSQGTTQ